MYSQIATRKTRVQNATQPPLNEQERFRIAFELADIGIGVVDQDGKFLAVNRKLAGIFKISKEELLRMSLSSLQVPRGDPPLRIPTTTELKSDTSAVVVEKRFISKEGKTLWVEISYAPYPGKNGAKGCVVASFHAITKRKLLQFALEKQASLDSLTKALNRVSFAERAGVELLRSGRHGYKLSMVMIDLDNFKAVNDTYGHATGDEVLSIFADITRTCLRIGDLFGRWGGEEFLILLPDTGSFGAEHVSERIRASLEAHRFPSGVRVTASLGVVSQRPGESFAGLVDRADTAMYQAKQAGRNRVVTNADDMYWESKSQSENSRPPELYWRKHYECGIPEIDNEHLELFRLANRILGSDGQSTEAAPLVDELLTHIAQHFKHEEQLLEANGFPMTQSHGQSHRKLLAHAHDLAVRFRKHETTAGVLMNFIVHELVARHMIQEDKEYFTWMKKKTSGGGAKRTTRARKSNP